jgi:hypothetical protein
VTPRRAARYRDVLIAYWREHAGCSATRWRAPRRTRCACSTRSGPTGRT